MTRNLLISLVVACSGFCSLVYQVVWDRVIRSHFGGDNVSSSIVTATFLLGLGGGALFFGRVRSRPFVTYAAIELAIGTYAIFSYKILGSLASFLGSALTHSIEEVGGVRSTMVAGCILFLLPPCVLMGGSLPLMLRCFISSGNYKSSSVGWLYGINTLGAATGALAAPFALLNRLHVSEALTLAGLLNFIIPPAVLFLSRNPAVVTVGAPTDLPGLRPSAPPPRRLLFIIAFVTGAVSIALEVSLFRHVFANHPSSAYNYPLIVVPFLIAIALGGILFVRIEPFTTEAALGRMGRLCIFSAAALVATLTGMHLWQQAESPFFALTRWNAIFYCLFMTAPFPLVLSGVFPILLRTAAATGSALPEETGKLYFTNSLGAFTGAMLAQFVGFEAVGVRGVLIVITTATLAVGIACRVASLRACRESGAPRSDGRFTFLSVAWMPATIVGCGIFIFNEPRAMTAFAHGSIPAQLPASHRVMIEGATGSAFVEWLDPGRAANVYTNGQIMSTIPDPVDHVGMIATLRSAPKRSRVLLLGLGGGGMVRRMAEDPGIESIEIVDWSHELPRLLQHPDVSPLIGNALSNPKVRIRMCDARVAVGLYKSATFDFIIDNLCILGWVGSTNVRSAAYFNEVNRILNPNGSYICRALGGDEAAKSIYVTLNSIWPRVLHHPLGFLVADRDNGGRDPAAYAAAVRAMADDLHLKPAADGNFAIPEAAAVPPDLVKGAVPVQDGSYTFEFPYASMMDFILRR